MTKTYQHKFKSGDTLMLTVDFSHRMPVIKCSNLSLATRFHEEYRQWRNEVVEPDMIAHLSPEQYAAMMELGYQTLKRALS